MNEKNPTVKFPPSYTRVHFIPKHWKLNWINQIDQSFSINIKHTRTRQLYWNFNFVSIFSGNLIIVTIDSDIVTTRSISIILI